MTKKLSFFEKIFSGKTKITEDRIKSVIGSEKILYNQKGNLSSGGKNKNGYLVLTDDKLYFLTAGKDGACIKELDLFYNQILFHKLHFVIFIEGPDHHIYEIKSGNNLNAYNILCKKLS